MDTKEIKHPPATVFRPRVRFSLAA